MIPSYSIFCDWEGDFQVQGYVSSGIKKANFFQGRKVVDVLPVEEIVGADREWGNYQIIIDFLLEDA